MEANEQKRVLDEWLSSHQGILFKVVRAYASTAHDRDDLFQELAIQLWNSVPTFRAESSVTTWIYRVALYSAIAWSRGETKHRDRNRELGHDEYLLAERDQQANPQLEKLYRSIARLTPLDRSLVLLLLDGLTHAEIAATLGITDNHVAVKLHRIKRSLMALSNEDNTDGL